MSSFTIIGTITADLFVRGAGDLAGPDGDGFRADNLIFTDEPLLLGMGGNGGNSAYVAASLGLDVALIGAVGRDALGDWLLQTLDARGVDTRAVAHVEHEATSTSTILLRSSEQQTVLHHLGASRAAHLDSAARQQLDQTEVLLASSLPILPAWRAGGFAEALRTVKQRGGTTALDIGPAIGEPVTLDEVGTLLPHVDYLIGNRHEFGTLGDGWAHTAQQLASTFTLHAIVKLGADGALALSQQDRTEAAAFDVVPRLTAGAGDSFNVGFLHGVRQGWPPGDALRYGCAVAARVITSARGVLDAPSRADVERYLEGGS